MEVTKIRNQNTTKSKAKIIIPVLLIALALVMAFSINDVSASEGTNAIYVDEDRGSDVDGDGSFETPYQSIGKGVDAVSENGIIKVAWKDLDDDELIYEGENNTEITIDKNMTIKGGFEFVSFVEGYNATDNRSTINAEGNTWIFHILQGVEVKLQNLTLMNGLAEDPDTFEFNDGGAIRNHGDLTVENCAFIDNKAERDGGAIRNYGSLTVIDCEFTGNSARRFGGAIYNTGVLNVYESFFDDNKAEDPGTDNRGGAIANNNGTLFVEDSDFGDENTNTNTADRGGAIANWGNQATATIVGTKFKNNKATRSGGAISNQSEMTIEDCRFYSNEATGENPGDGGAIANTGDLTVEDSYFIDNEAARAGGAIANQVGELIVWNSYFGSLEEDENNANGLPGNTAFVGGAIANLGGTVWINDSEFIENDAQFGGAISNGAIVNDEPVGTDAGVVIVDSEFIANTAKTSGGAIWNIGDLEVAYSYFGNLLDEDDEEILSGNHANVDGGAIRNAGTADIYQCTFTKNEALNGGAIANKAHLTVAESTFEGNNSDRDGGAIHNEALDVTEANVTITGTSFEGNNADRNGGAIFNRAWDEAVANLEITGSTFEGNTSNNSGGAIFNVARDNAFAILDITGGNFEGNTATSFYGGAIFNWAREDAESILEITGSTFTDNDAVYGGAIANRADATDAIAFVTISDSDLIANTANLGGAIYNSGNLLVSETYFGSLKNEDNENLPGNHATVDGGAIRNVGTASIINCLFYENSADEDGGAIAIANAGALVVTNSNFEKNSADDYGGAIFNKGQLLADDCSFLANEAYYGGAIHNRAYEQINNEENDEENDEDPEDPAIISDSLFEANKANYGGAIHNQGRITIEYCLLEKNTADNGGAIYNESNEVAIATIKDSDLEKNNATTAGGAIYNSGELVVENTYFIENSVPKADGNGGAIYNSEDLLVKNSAFIGNEANDGGAIYNDFADLKIISSTFTDNFARSEGGAIHSIGTSDLTANFNIFCANVALARGDAIRSFAAADIELNYWGKNNPNFNELLTGTNLANPDEWIYMKFSVEPDTIRADGQEASTLTADFNWKIDGATETITPLVGGHIRDGTMVTFTTDLGVLASQTVDKPTADGVAEASLTSTDHGTATVTATLCEQTRTGEVTIEEVPEPIVIEFDPANGEMNVPVDKIITVTFNQDVFEGAPLPGIRLRDTDRLVDVPIVITGWGTDQLTLTPVDDLMPGTRYRIIIHTGSVVNDLDDPVALTDSFFYTEGTVPEVVKVVPLPDSIGVPVNALIRVFFDQRIEFGDPLPGIRLRIPGVADVPITTEIVGNVLRINPIDGLQPGTNYRIIIHTGSIVGLSGDPVSLFTSDFRTRYTLPAPEVQAIVPAKGAVNVPVTTNIQITFQQDVIFGNPVPGIRLRIPSAAADVPITTNIVGNLLTITPDVNLAPGTLYNVILHTDSVRSIEGRRIELWTSQFTTAA